MKKFFLIAALAVIFFGGLAALTIAVNDCNDKQGVLVRGVWWYACVVGAEDDE